MMWMLLAFAACSDDPDGGGVTLTRIEVTPPTASVPAGIGQQLTATGVFSDAESLNITGQVAWSSSDATIAEVSSSGAVAGVAVGTATITAQLGAIRGQVTVTVTAALLESIDVTPTNPKLALGRAQQLAATGTFSDDTTMDLTTQVTWSSDADARVTVDNVGATPGKVTAVAAGDTTITATLGKVSGSTTVTVTNAVLESIEVTPTVTSLPAGLAQPFKATGIFSDNSNMDLTEAVTWASDKTELATISDIAGSKGLATTVKVGEVTISATLEGVVGTATLTVNDAVLAKLDVTPASASVAAGLEQPFKAMGTFSNDSAFDLTNQVAWASENSDVATVSNADGSKGVALGRVVGEAKITATLGDVSGSTTLTVTEAELVSIRIEPANVSVPVTFTEQFKATGRFTDTSIKDLTTQVTWASDTEAVATISNAAGSNGLATAVEAGEAKITATMGNVTSTATLTVTDAKLTSIAIEPAIKSLAMGLTQQFTATGTFSDTTTRNLTTAVTWASDADATATISNADGSKGLAKAVAVGAARITAILGDVTGEATLTVTVAELTSIAIEPVDPSVEVGKTLQLTATGTLTDGSKLDQTAKVTWTSDNEAVVTISSEGVATAVTAGDANITATIDGVTATAKLTVTEPAPPLRARR